MWNRCRMLAICGLLLVAGLAGCQSPAMSWKDRALQPFGYNRLPPQWEPDAGS